MSGGVCHTEATRTASARIAPAMKQQTEVHRKHWEYSLIMEHARGTRGLGFGVGVDPLADYFASLGCQITATDLVTDDCWFENWQTRLNHRQICPAAEFAKRVTTRHVDMNWIPGDLRDFDFCWSCCSLDHLGSIRLGKRFVYRSLECLRPGGIAIHTGEFNLSSDWNTLDYADTVLWTRDDIDEVLAYVRERGHDAPFDWTIGDLGEKVWPTNKNHVRLMFGGFLCTSFGLVITRGANGAT